MIDYESCHVIKNFERIEILLQITLHQQVIENNIT